VGTAQLMAGLVSEAMLVADTSELKSPAPFERNALLDALEKVSPSLKPSADKPPQKEAVPVSPPSQPAPVNPMEDLLREAYATTCAGCGNPLEEGEAFCGSCGMARPGRSGTSTQSKFASLWRMQQAAEKNRGEAPSPSSPPAKLTAPPAVLHSIPAKSSKLPETIPSDTLSPVPAWPGMDASHDVDVPRSMEGENLDHSLAHESTALSIPASLTLSEVEPDLAAETVSQEAEHSLRIIPDEVSDLPVTAKSPWTSARKTREWLDALKHPQGPWITASYWWRQHRANVYVALAALIFSVSVVMLIAAPSHEHAVPESATSAAHRRKAPPPPEMTMFEKFLVSIGLAEPPDAPAYMGNPNAKVWVDVHTALYYCPGAELYGKTEGGKFTTQRDAQQDQFQPASRKVCD